MLNYIKKNYSWLFKSNQKIITHNDIDGILSYLYLHHKLNWELSGYYNLREIYIKDNKYNLDDYIYVDLDMNNNKKSIGHHFMLIDNNKALNMNNIFIEKKRENYTSKCPLPTILILHWLMEDNTFYNDFNRLAWILYADSFIISFKKYNRNCIEWLKRIKMFELINILNDEKKLNKIYNIIENEIIPIINLYKHCNTINFNKYTLNQCFFNINKNKNSDFYYVNNFKKFEEFIYSINNHLKFKNINSNMLLYRMKKPQNYFTYSINYNKEIYFLLKNKKIISNAITYLNSKQIKLQITLQEDIYNNEQLKQYII